jgi:hypothetical protein
MLNDTNREGLFTKVEFPHWTFRAFVPSLVFV